MKTYLICVTMYFIALMTESSTPTWMRILSAVCLVTLCVEAVFDQYRVEKRIKTLEEKLNDVPKDED